jgi:PAS domain S-box-containing protein
MSDDPGLERRVSLYGVLEALPVAALVVDASGRIRAVNARGLALVGEAGRAGADVIESLFAEPEQGAADEVQRKVLRGQAWQGELPVVRASGDARAAHVSWTPLRASERMEGSLLVLEELSTSRRQAQRQAQRLAERLTSLARAAADLLEAKDLDEVSEIVTGQLADAAGATVASLSVLEEEARLRLIGMRGGRAGAIDRWRTYSTVGTPAGDAVTSGAPLILIGRDEIRSRYPDLESAADGERSLVCLPLLIGSRRLGVVTMTFPGRRMFSGTELEFFSVMADTCSQAIDRLRAVSAAADRAAKLRFLADATAELASSLDYEATLANVAQAAVPWFADWCSIALGFDAELRTIAVAHVNPEKVALAREFQERYPPDPTAAQGSYQVFRSGESQLTPEITDEMLDLLVEDDAQRDFIRVLNLRSAISVPLKLGNRVLGVITWVAGEQGRRFTTDDVSFGEDLARRAAVAIDNAQLHTELREMAVRLQRAVLPTALPELDGWEFAAHYSPAGHLEAGGDFYDIIPLDDSRIAFFIGDVMGRGFQAAAAMAQMRSAVRLLVAVDPDPMSVLTRLDTFFDRYELNQLVTMMYAVADPGTNQVTIANAGHLPPVIIRADGHTEIVANHEELLLGAGTAPRSVGVFDLFPGDALLAFTDGLVERRDEDIDDSQARLLHACEALQPRSITEPLDVLVEQVTDPNRDDDVAAILVRRLS